MRFPVIFAALLAGAALSTAFAQQQGQQEQERLPQAQEDQQQQQAQLSPDARNIIGKTAISPQGKEAGKIEDVLVDQDGKVQAMVVDHEGKKRAVPWNQVSMQGDQVTVKMSDEQMSQLPEYRLEKD